MKIVSDVEAHSRIKTESALQKVRHVMHVIKQDIFRQFVELRTKETNLTQNRLGNLKLSFGDANIFIYICLDKNSRSSVITSHWKRFLTIQFPSPPQG